MTVSLTRLEIKQVLHLKTVMLPSLLVILFSFVVLGGLNIALAYTLTDDPYLRAGFVVLAAVPPSMTIPPFSYNLHANVALSYMGTTIGYLASIIILPVSLFVFFGHDYDSRGLFVLIGQIIVLPMILSRVVRKTPLNQISDISKGRLINWCLAFVVFSLIGINRDTIIAFPDYVGVSVLIAFVTIFVIGEMIFRISRALKHQQAETVVFMLFGTMKKWAGASAISHILFGPIAVLPPITAMIVGFIFYFWLAIRFGRSALSGYQKVT